METFLSGLRGGARTYRIATYAHHKSKRASETARERARARARAKEREREGERESEEPESERKERECAGSRERDSLRVCVCERERALLGMRGTLNVQLVDIQGNYSRNLDAAVQRARNCSSASFTLTPGCR